VKLVVGREALASFEGPSCVTVGTYDGVHRGHRAVLAAVIERARASGLHSVLVTWDRHPAQTLRPDQVPPLLTTPERRIELLGDTGLDVVCILRFDLELSRWPPERFATEVLATGLGARHLVVGQGWRFGHRAAGDVSLLAHLGDQLGFTVEASPLVEVEGGPASSSRARTGIAAGDLALVTAILGRPHELAGVVVHGEDRGASLGYPTANLSADAAVARPPHGIYACRARLGGRKLSAAVSVGVNPTFGGVPGASPVRIEAFLLDFKGEIYGDTLTLEWIARLRDELAFDSVADLVAQMAKDVEATRRLT